MPAYSTNFNLDSREERFFLNANTTVVDVTDSIQATNSTYLTLPTGVATKAGYYSFIYELQEYAFYLDENVANSYNSFSFNIKNFSAVAMNGTKHVTEILFAKKENLGFSDINGTVPTRINHLNILGKTTVNKASLIKPFPQNIFNHKYTARLMSKQVQELKVKSDDFNQINIESAAYNGFEYSDPFAVNLIKGDKKYWYFTEEGEYIEGISPNSSWKAFEIFPDRETEYIIFPHTCETSFALRLVILDDKGNYTSLSTINSDNLDTTKFVAIKGYRYFITYFELNSWNIPLSYVFTEVNNLSRFDVSQLRSATTPYSYNCVDKYIITRYGWHHTINVVQSANTVWMESSYYDLSDTGFTLYESPIFSSIEKWNMESFEVLTSNYSTTFDIVADSGNTVQFGDLDGNAKLYIKVPEGETPPPIQFNRYTLSTPFSGSGGDLNISSLTDEYTYILLSFSYPNADYNQHVIEVIYVDDEGNDNGADYVFDYNHFKPYKLTDSSIETNKGLYEFESDIEFNSLSIPSQIDVDVISETAVLTSYVEQISYTNTVSVLDFMKETSQVMLEFNSGYSDSEHFHSVFGLFSTMFKSRVLDKQKIGFYAENIYSYIEGTLNRNFKDDTTRVVHLLQHIPNRTQVSLKQVSTTDKPQLQLNTASTDTSTQLSPEPTSISFLTAQSLFSFTIKDFVKITQTQADGTLLNIYSKSFILDCINNTTYSLINNNFNSYDSLENGIVSVCFKHGADDTLIDVTETSANILNSYNTFITTGTEPITLTIRVRSTRDLTEDELRSKFDNIHLTAPLYRENVEQLSVHGFGSSYDKLILDKNKVTIHKHTFMHQLLYDGTWEYLEDEDALYISNTFGAAEYFTDHYKGFDVEFAPEGIYITSDTYSYQELLNYFETHPLIILAGWKDTCISKEKYTLTYDLTTAFGSTIIDLSDSDVKLEALYLSTLEVDTMATNANRVLQFVTTAITGDLSLLSTEQKSNLVAAINSVNEQVYISDALGMVYLRNYVINNVETSAITVVPKFYIDEFSYYGIFILSNTNNDPSKPASYNLLGDSLMKVTAGTIGSDIPAFKSTSLILKDPSQYEIRFFSEEVGPEYYNSKFTHRCKATLSDGTDYQVGAFK